MRAIVSLPAWSPDGTQLVFVGPSFAIPPTGTRHFVSSISIRRHRALLPLPDGIQGVMSPSWSSDGHDWRRSVLGSTWRQQRAHRRCRFAGSHAAARIDTGGCPRGQLVARGGCASPLDDDRRVRLVCPARQRGLPGFDRRTVDIAGYDANPGSSRPIWAPDGVRFAYLERGTTLHIRVRTGIGERTLELPQQGEWHDQLGAGRSRDRGSARSIWRNRR